MALTLLGIVQEMCGRTGLSKPLQAAGSLDPQVQQMVSLLNEELDEVSLRCRWQEMTKEFVFTTTGVSDQGTLDQVCGASEGYILNDAMWDRTQRLPVFGPVSPQRWQQYVALPITGTLLQYKIEGGHLLLYPTAPPAGHIIGGEFVLAGAVLAADGVTVKTYFTNDTDTCVLKDSILLAGLRWRWKREKGLAYAEDKQRYENIVSDLMARNGTGRVLSLSGDQDNYFGPGILVPSGSWNINGGALPMIGGGSGP